MAIRGLRLGLPDHSRCLADEIDAGWRLGELSAVAAVLLEALIIYGASFLSRIPSLGV
jgi:hypothetical protein